MGGWRVGRGAGVAVWSDRGLSGVEVWSDRGLPGGEVWTDRGLPGVEVRTDRGLPGVEVRTGVEVRADMGWCVGGGSMGAAVRDSWRECR
jgi:hypothetical protein